MVSKSFTIFVVILSALFLSNIAIAQTDWTGEYFFEEDGGETAGGSRIYVAHTLTVSEVEGALTARLYSQGFQTSYDIFATAESVENKLNLYLDKYGPDQVFEGLKKGDLVFSLEWSDGRLLTNWGGFKPILISNESNGEVRFVKTTLNEKENEVWERIAYTDGEVSAAVPAGFIFDDRKDKFYRSRIYAYYKGVNIQLSFHDSGLFKNDRFRKSLEKEGEGVRFISPNYVTVIPTRISDSSFAKRIRIIGPKIHLEIVLSGHVESLGEIGEFIDGLRLSGIGLSENSGPETVPSEISVSDLKRSEVVAAALKRKPKNIARKVSYEISTNNTETPDVTPGTRNAIVLDVPDPGKRSAIVPRILVHLRADGDVGDMVVYSSQSAKDLKKYIRAATKIKFIPAVRDGQNVDSWAVVSFPVTFVFSL